MPKLSEILRDRGIEPRSNSRAGMALAEAGIGMTPELARILAMPRRAATPSVDLTSEFRLRAKCEGGCELCKDGDAKLKPFQSMMIDEARSANGLFAPVAVGEGKTLSTLLLPRALGSTRAVLFVKPSLMPQLLGVDVPLYARHFVLPPVTRRPSLSSRNDGLFVVSYSVLSLADTATILEDIQPDLIIADEAHNFRHKDSARTKRFLRYMKNHPECRFCALSGTMVTRSLFDYAHLIELALKKNSPLPNKWTELRDWAAVLDDALTGVRMQPGKLLLFTNGDEDVRSGFRRRLVETEGVVSTTESALGTSLIVSKRKIDTPLSVQSALANLKATWSWDGEEFEDILALARISRQLACGFYYRWVWPNGKDEEWLEARRDWHKEVRDFLHRRAKPGLDSPLLLAQAAAMGRWQSTTWSAWCAVKDRPEPPTEPVWLSDFMVKDAIKWAEEGGIIWYEHDAVGQALALKGLRVFGAGKAAAELLSMITPEEYPVIVCSIKAHGTGRNLQKYSRNLITTPPANGTTWEQLLGRTHRPGQEADEVVADVYQHTEEFCSAVQQALKDAAYIEATQGQKQKLRYATRML